MFEAEGAGAIRACIAGEISPQVAVSRMVLAGQGGTAIRAALDAAAPHPAVDAMRALLDGRTESLDALAAEVRAPTANHDASGHTPEAVVAQIAAFFDRAVRYSPEASVAIYSLGDGALLEAATAELVAWLEAQRLVGPETDVLDLGCGIGRLAAELGPRCRSVLGLDVSPGMVAEATRRLSGLPNVQVRQTAGQGLDMLDPASFDLVLAADCFPYLVQTGEAVARRHVLDAARALRPGGALAVLNWSYGGGPVRDAAQARSWAADAGLRVRLLNERPLPIWDATATVLVRE